MGAWGTGCSRRTPCSRILQKNGGMYICVVAFFSLMWPLLPWFHSEETGIAFSPFSRFSSSSFFFFSVGAGDPVIGWRWRRPRRKQDHEERAYCVRRRGARSVVISARGQHVRALADITGHRDRIGRGTAEPLVARDHHVLYARRTFWPFMN